MKGKNALKAKIILGIYLIATLALLLCGYSLKTPAVKTQEFPFTITYTCQGVTETISDVYVGEYVRQTKYLGDPSTAWYGYVKDRNRLESDFYHIAESDGQSFSIDLNMIAGYLMGDPRFEGSQCQPSGKVIFLDEQNETVITDPVELEQLGFVLVDWEYPAPIENSFSYGGISLSSEATVYTALLALATLPACMILIKKDPQLSRGKLDKLSVVLNFLVALIIFPFILAVSVLSELVADTSFWQQLLYLAPALTLAGVAASVTLRRMGHKALSFGLQFAGPAVFGLIMLLETL